MEGLNMKQLIVCKSLQDFQKQKEVIRIEQYFEYEFDQQLGFIIHYYDLQCSINLEDFFKLIKSGYIIISLGQALILSLKLIEHLIEIHLLSFTLGKISNQHIWINLEGISKRIQCNSFQQIFYKVQFINIQNDLSKDEDFDHFKHIIFEIFISLLVYFKGQQQDIKLVSGILDNLKRQSDVQSLFQELKQLNQKNVNQQTQQHHKESTPIRSYTTFRIYEYLYRNIQQLNIQESQTFTFKYLKCMIQKIKSYFLIDQVRMAATQNDSNHLKKTDFEFVTNLINKYQIIFDWIENNNNFQKWFENLQNEIKQEYEKQFKLTILLDQQSLEKFKEYYLKFQIYMVASTLRAEILRESPQKFLEEINLIQNDKVKPFVQKIYKEKIQEEFEIQIYELALNLI